MSAMYSKNGVIINKNGTTGVATIKSEDGTVKVNTTTLPNGVQYDLSVNTDIIGMKEVSHDNTLSGNGTMDNPLSVVPGYNETVLWEGSYSGRISDSNYITLSERPDNFEFISISNTGYGTTFMYSGNAHTWSFLQTYANNSDSTIYVNRYAVAIADKKVTCKASNSMILNSRGVISWQNRPSMDVGETILAKVVGINRKASNV